MEDIFRKTLYAVDSYDGLLSFLKSNDMVIDDLVTFGTLRQSNLKAIKNAFKGKETDKSEYKRFTDSATEYYCLICTPCIIAYSNKKRSKV